MASFQSLEAAIRAIEMDVRDKISALVGKNFPVNIDWSSLVEHDSHCKSLQKRLDTYLDFIEPTLVNITTSGSDSILRVLEGNMSLSNAIDGLEILFVSEALQDPTGIASLIKYEIQEKKLRILIDVSSLDRVMDPASLHLGAQLLALVQTDTSQLQTIDTNPLEFELYVRAHGGTHSHRALRADPALRARIELNQNPLGGLMLSSNGCEVILDDTLDFIAHAFLYDAPRALKAGEKNFGYRLRLSHGSLGIYLDGDVVRVMDDNSDTLETTLQALLATLEQARVEYESLLALDTHNRE